MKRTETITPADWEYITQETRMSCAEVTAIVRAMLSDTGSHRRLAQHEILLYHSRNVPWLRQLQEQKSAAVRARQAASLFAIFDLQKGR